MMLPLTHFLDTPLSVSVQNNVILVSAMFGKNKTNKTNSWHYEMPIKNNKHYQIDVMPFVLQKLTYYSAYVVLSLI